MANPMYHTVAEMQELGDMSTIAERVGAKSIMLKTGGLGVRGYDFDPRNLDEKERDFVFRSLFPVGLEAFVQNPSEGMEKDIADHVFTAEHLVVMRSDGTYSFGAAELGKPRPIAFRMWKMYDTKYGRALYLAGMCVLPRWQGTGIGKEMTKYVLEIEKPDLVFTVTQNPVAKQSMDSCMGYASYPLFGGIVTPPLKEVGIELAKVRGIEDHYNPDTMVLTGHYGSKLYGEMPVSHDWRYEQLFQRIDREKGDAYLCVSM